MDIKQINEELIKFLHEDSVDSMLEQRYHNYIGSAYDEGLTYYDFDFIYFGELSDDAFEKVQSHIDELQGIDKTVADGVVFFTSGDLLFDHEEGYIHSGIEIKDGVELTDEILDKFDNFCKNIYKEYIKAAGYKNLDGDINDIAPVNVDFVIEKNEYTENDDVLAVFPELTGRIGEYRGYRHIGQHTSIHPDYYKSLEKATKEQYMPLYNELTNQIGYNLNVLNSDF